MVDIDAGDIQSSCCGEMIHLWLDAIGVTPPVEIEIVGKELIWARVLAHEGGLPSEIVRHESALEFCECGGQACIDGAVHRGEVFPAINTIAPIVEAELLIQRGEVGIAASHPLHESGLHV